MEKIWTDAPLLYFHFNSSNGCFASLPMRRIVRIFMQPFRGIPGTQYSISEKREPRWHVPGYQCLGCGRAFFAATIDGLKHECMNHGGIVSESQIMGV